MRKKLDTRFPASRIKKIMQADEDVGKIALAVPVLVSKALELFLQDLCDRTYDITLQRGMKTMSSMHLKQCVHSYNVFDFLKDVVSKVPDIGGSDAGGEDKSSKRRRGIDDDNESDDESKKNKIDTTGHGSSTSSRGRGRGRGRGRSSRGNRTSIACEKYEEDPGTSPQHDGTPSSMKIEPIDERLNSKSWSETADGSNTNSSVVRNFDLNLDLNEKGDAAITAETTTNAAGMLGENEIKHEEYPGWSVSDMNKMGVDPLQMALSSKDLDEEEDYDEEW